MMIETCRSIFKCFDVNNLSVCIGWCADEVTSSITCLGLAEKSLDKGIKIRMASKSSRSLAPNRK